ncbi:MAG: hypothetical protein P4L64_11905 [Caulobacteraceae bacterium]|nr:hypothetical protein [Caulobacteraceae bacterium]
MLLSFRHVPTILVCSALLFGQGSTAYAQAVSDSAGFAATGIDGRTEVDRTIGKCIAAVAAGALVGALIGGRRNAGSGAAIGAGLGVGACAIMMSVANAHDRERLRELQLQSLNSGQSRSDQWRTSDGHEASATVTASNVVQVTAQKSSEVLNCRRINTQVDAQGRDTSTSDVVCLHGDKWMTLDKLKDIGIQPSDVSI